MPPNMPPLVRTVSLTRYVTPLREGGSLPAVMEADDDGLYAVKFRGAGQGPKALVAELVAGEIGRALGLAVPEIVLAQLDAAFGRNEPDQEIQDLLRASVGLNLALDYLPGALAYDPLAPPPQLDARLASEIVWFDAYITNVDRTARNTNLLLWHGRLWLIDHGAALYFHHAWGDYLVKSRTPFAPIKEHVLLPLAGELAAADAALRPKLTQEVLERIVAALPAAWLEVGAGTPFDSVEAQRAAYVAYLTSRLDAAANFVEEAQRARALLV